MVLEKVVRVLAEDGIGEKDLAVVPRVDLLPNGSFSGVMCMDETELLDLLSNHMQFRERNEDLEKDETMKQIIPYFVVRKEDKYLVARRNTSQGEIRLHEKELIGFGGHLRKEDIQGKLGDWLKREFDEEIDAERVLGISFLGMLNDDSGENNGVNKVHFGLVFEIKVEGEVKIKEQEKFREERFETVKQLDTHKEEMETWSRLVVEYLVRDSAKV